MKKYIKITLVILFILGIVLSISKVVSSNSKDENDFPTDTVKVGMIEKKVVAMGKIIPDDEVEIKPYISGIIEKLYAKEGERVKIGDLLAKIKVVPNEESLKNAENGYKIARFNFKKIEIDFKRNKDLYEKKFLSDMEYNDFELKYEEAKLNLENASNKLKIIKSGTVDGSSAANTFIKSTINGTILEIPIKKGDQVIESNNFNPGTTIAKIADMSNLIFEGKIDESEISKLRVNMPMDITIGSMDGLKFSANLRFIAPKGIEEQGTVFFKLEGDLKSLDSTVYIYAGLSANAKMVTAKEEGIPVLNEGLLQFKDNKPFVEVKKEDGDFEKRWLKIGISDGIKCAIDSGLSVNEVIKVWNPTKKTK